MNLLPGITSFSLNGTLYPLTPFNHNEAYRERSQSLFSPFYPEGSPQEAFLSFLFECGVINENGLLNEKHQNITLPPLDSIQKQMLEDFLGSSFFSITTREFLLSTQIDELEILRMECIGGIVRKILLSSSPYILETLSRLTNVPPEVISSYITDELTAERNRPLPDVDIRTTFVKASPSMLYECIKKVLEQASILTNTPPEEARRSLLANFSLITENQNEFSLASLQSLDLIYVHKLQRSHLFALDAIRINIFELLTNPFCEPTFESDIHHGGQSLLDLLTRVIHIQNPKNTNCSAFPLLISYFTRGYVFGDPKEHLEAILENGKSLLVNYQDPAIQLTALLCSTYAKHHSPNIHTILSIGATAFLHLEKALPPKSLILIWSNLENRFWAEQDNALESSCLGKIALLMKSSKVSELTPDSKASYLTALFAAQAFGAWFYLSTQEKCPSISVRSHVGSPALQFWMGEIAFLLPLSCKKSLEILHHFFAQPAFLPFQDDVLEIIESFAFQKPRAQSFLTSSPESIARFGLDAHELEQTSETFFKLPNRCTYYIGYLCLLASMSLKPKPQLIPQLLSRFIESTAKKSQVSRTSILLTLINSLESSGEGYLIDSLKSFMKSMETLSTEMTLFFSWIHHLASCPNASTATLAHSLWAKYREKYSLEVRRQNDLALIDLFSQNAHSEALTLFLHCQQGSHLPVSEKELALLCSLLDSANHAPSAAFAIEMPRLTAILSIMFSSGRSYEVGVIPPSPLVGLLGKLLSRLLAANNFVQARSLWELIAVHPLLCSETAVLEEGWLRLTQSALEHQRGIREATALWKKSLQARTHDLYLQVIFALTQELLKYSGNEQPCLKNLIKIIQADPTNDSVVKFTLNYLKYLAESGKAVKAARSIKKVFSACPESQILETQKQTLCHQLIRALIAEKEWMLAVNIWFLLPPKSQNTKLTTQLLQELTKANLSPFAVSLGLKVLSSAKSKDIAPNVRLNFLKVIGHTIGLKSHGKHFVAFLHVLFREFPRILLPKDRLELVLSVIQAASQLKPLSPRVAKRILRVLLPVIALLKTSKQWEPFVDLISLLESSGIPFPEELFPDLFVTTLSVIEHFIENKETDSARLWISRGKQWSSASELVPWCENLLTLFKTLPGDAFPKFILEQSELLTEALESKKLNTIIEEWLTTVKELSDETLRLIQKHPPMSTSAWEVLFTQAKPEQLSVVWESFESWDPQFSDCSPAKKYSCVLTAFKTLHLTRKAPFKRLLAELADNTSFYHVMHIMDKKAFFEACELVLSAFLRNEITDYDFNDFLNLYETLGNTLDVNPEMLGPMVTLLEEASKTQNIKFISLSIKMLSIIMSRIPENFIVWDYRIIRVVIELIVHANATGFETELEELIGLSATIQCYVYTFEQIPTLTPSEIASLPNLVILEQTLSCLALALSNCNSIKASTCCHCTLNMIQSIIKEPSPVAARAWGNYLTKSMKSKDLSRPEERGLAILILSELCNEWKQEEGSFNDCLGLTLDLIITFFAHDQFSSADHDLENLLRMLLEVEGLDAKDPSGKWLRAYQYDFDTGQFATLENHACKSKISIAEEPSSNNEISMIKELSSANEISMIRGLSSNSEICIIGGLPYNCDLSVILRVRKMYFRVIQELLEKIMRIIANAPDENPKLYKLAFFYLEYLCMNYKEKNEALIDLVEFFVFMVPRTCHFFDTHKIMAMVLVEKVLYTRCFDRAFRAFSYLNYLMLNVNKIPPKAFMNSLLWLTDKVFQQPPGIAIPFIISIIKIKDYFEIYKSSPVFVEQFLKKIISNVTYNKTPKTYLGDSLFEEIVENFLVHLSHITTTSKGLEIATKLTHFFVQKAWEASIPELNFQREYESLMWMANLLIESRRVAAFARLEDFPLYLTLVKKIVSRFIANFKHLNRNKMSDENFTHLITCIKPVNCLIVMEDLSSKSFYELCWLKTKTNYIEVAKLAPEHRKHVTHCKIPKAIKLEIVKLMKEWLSSLDIPHEALVAAVTHAESLGVFDDSPKEFKKFKGKLLGDQASHARDRT